MVQIKLKWGKEEYDVDVDEPSVEVFKTKVYSLTNVPVDKQKYLGFPGGMLKDTDDVVQKASNIKAGAKVTLVGTAEAAQLKAPAEKVVFEEDLSPEEKAKLLKEKKAEIMPAGIQNLGNTCYMNSTLQCLASIKELKDAVGAYTPPSAGDRDIDAVLTAQFRTVLEQLSGTTEYIVPLQFVMALRQKFPRFAEMQNGAYMQQDAEECMRGLLQVLAVTLPSGGSNRVDDLTSFTMTSTLKCLECDEEAPQVMQEAQRVLMCHLGTQTNPVSHIHQGVQLSLKEHIEKNSPVLGRSAQYEKSSCISSLPPYLIVQFARFGYKGANEWAGTSASKVKLTRKCAFSTTFDLFDSTSDELKKELSKGRLAKKEQEDAKIEKERQKRLAKDKNPDEEDVEMKPVEDVEMKAGMETMDTGYYELVAIVSHKGRTADGGHYVGWSLHKKADGKENKEDRWLCYDDETVTAHDWKDIVGLSIDLQGGKADTQMAYINIYKKVTVTVDSGKMLGSGEAAPAETAAASSSNS
mmetsp:Transcript_62192/g.148373  ORF Transcript_62192/g.148373 Transcript_62192/m.148373 type:complete len:523 (+) Transcript_62192:84-1652(+)